MFNMDAKISLYSYTILSECSCHRLPLWEPFAVLGILAILVEIIFYYQKDYSSVSDREKYCHKCVKKIVNSDKYYANFGGKL